MYVAIVVFHKVPFLVHCPTVSLIICFIRGKLVKNIYLNEESNPASAGILVVKFITCKMQEDNPLVYFISASNRCYSHMQSATFSVWDKLEKLPLEKYCVNATQL